MSIRVSVVIPTVGKPALADAVRSVLAQTYPPHEVLICLDAKELPKLTPDARIKVLRVGPGAGGNAARQAGIDAATGDVVALLDDDDLWHTEKLKTQVQQVRDVSPSANWVATSRVRAIQADGRVEVWPSRLLRPGERLTNYIFRKTRVVGGVGFVQASTLLFPVSLGRRFPFDVSLRHHQDIDWLRRIDLGVPSLIVMQSHEALTDYIIGEGTVSKRISWRESVEWSSQNLAGDPRSIGDFILTSASLYAARSGSPISVLASIGAGLRRGRPGLPAIVFASANVGRSVIFAFRTWIASRKSRR